MINMLEAQHKSDQSEQPQKAIRQAEKTFKKEMLESKRETQNHALQVLLALIEINNGVKGCHLISDVVNAFKHPAVTYHTLKYRLKCYRVDPSNQKVLRGGLICPKYVGVPVPSNSCGEGTGRKSRKRISDEFDTSDGDISPPYKHHKPLTGRTLISPSMPADTCSSSSSSCSSDSLSSSSSSSSNSSMNIHYEREMKRLMEERRKLELQYRLLRRKDMDLHQLNAIAIQHCDSPMK